MWSIFLESALILIPLLTTTSPGAVLLLSLLILIVFLNAAKKEPLVSLDAHASGSAAPSERHPLSPSLPR